MRESSKTISFLGMGRGLFLLFFLLANAKALADLKCGGSSFTQNTTWCVDRTPESLSKTVIYYLHGNGGDANAWNTPDHQWLMNQIPLKRRPTIITISLGSTWFLNDKNLVEFLETAQAVEMLQLGSVSHRRIVFGESMGGFNASVLLFKKPNVFEKIVISCPAIYPVGPYDSSSVQNSFVESMTGSINQKFFYKWMNKLKSAFPNQELWKSSSPLDQVSVATAKSVYLMANTGDGLGLFPGAVALKDQLKNQGFDLNWNTVPTAAHCAYDSQALDQLSTFLQ